MSLRLRAIFLVVLLGALGLAADAATAFTYQGSLKTGALLANGTFDMVFRLYDVTNVQVGASIEKASVPVTNGVFTVELDFGSLFPPATQLEIGIRPGGTAGAYTFLTPKHALTSVPYAVRASRATVADSATTTPNAWSILGNTGTDAATNYLGTGDNTPLILAVNGKPGWSLWPTASTPNIIGGWVSPTGNFAYNRVLNGAVGAVIGGGGFDDPEAYTHAFMNSTSSNYSVIGGGQGNWAGSFENTDPESIPFITIGGGYCNTAYGGYGIIGGGQSNQIQPGATGATIGGGTVNTAGGNYATVPGGYYNTAAGAYSFAAGRRAKANHGGAFVWADSTDVDFPSTATNAFDVRAGGGVRMAVGLGQWRLTTGTYSPNLVAGHTSNSIGAGVSGGVVAGGGTSSSPNAVTSFYGTVSGGIGNTAGGTGSAPSATVGGGASNTASGTYSVVAGGYINQASGNSAAVGGGQHNTANANYATVPGGSYNTAQGAYSFAAGQNARAFHTGTFVWNDAADTVNYVDSAADNQFIVRASGGVWFGTTRVVSIPAGRFINTSTGGYLSTGGSWINSSDRALKEHFTPVDSRDVLRRVVALPITTWNYTAEGADVRHLGPVAQDFFAAFRLGNDDRAIGTLDEAGVALAAIQGLYAHTREENAALKAQLATLQTRLAVLERLVRAQRVAP